MKCPNCKEADHFRIEAETVRMVDVDTDGNVLEDDGGDILWEDASKAECGECEWTGTVKELEDADETRY